MWRFQVIVDPAAGTGNLESVLTDDELSHVIVNTYELKAATVLEDRIGGRVRYNMAKDAKINENGLIEQKRAGRKFPALCFCLAFAIFSC